jgi:DNA-binding MarR family transcriptional regulator
MSAQNFEIYLSFNAHTGAFLQAFFARSREKIMAIFEKHEAGEGADAGLAQTAAAVSPDTAKTADYLARQPYAKPEFVQETLQAAADRGWISMEGNGFKATQKAHDLNDALIQFLLDELNPLADEISVDVPDLVKDLAGLVEAAAKVKLPLKPTFTFGRHFEYDDKTPSMTWVRRHLISLNSFRDDCHLSSWQEHKLPGYVWETLSFIWQGDAATAEKLAETLSGYRGYQAEDYTAAIEQLVEMGWIEAKDDGYQVTAKGKQVRERAEELTNQYYAKAFAALSEAQVKDLAARIETIAGEIAPEEQPEAEGA